MEDLKWFRVLHFVPMVLDFTIQRLQVFICFEVVHFHNSWICSVSDPPLTNYAVL
jgi:hypothetical protein